MTLEQRLRALGRNPTAVVGAAAGVGLVWIGWRQLRQSPAPIVIAGPATAPDTGATAVAAFQAGAAAASSGFDTGAALGQSALGLAGSAVGDLGGAVGTLAGSQADMGATLSGALSDAIGAITQPAQSPAPAPAPAPQPGTTPVPPPPSPSQLGPHVRVTLGTFTTYTRSTGGHSLRQAPVNTVYPVAPSPVWPHLGMSLVQLTGGPYAGLWVNPHGALAYSAS